MTSRSTRSSPSHRGGNRRLLLGLIGIVVGMNVFAYAAVPAYRAFCQNFGFAGTPLRADVQQQPIEVIDRSMTVRFNSDTDPGLPWRFRPVQREITLKVGETGLAFFEATNLSDETITGTATFNVVPLKAGPYFVKVDCFCFTEQTLRPGEHVEMPVSFYVDPEISAEGNLDEVGTITLSYTFFRDRAAEAENRTAALPRAAASVN